MALDLNGKLPRQFFEKGGRRHAFAKDRKSEMPLNHGLSEVAHSKRMRNQRRHQGGSDPGMILPRRCEKEEL